LQFKIFTISFWYPRSLTIAAYAFITDNININLEDLINEENLPSFYMFDNDVYYSQFTILGNRNKTQKDECITLPKEESTYLTIPYSKSDILYFMFHQSLPNKPIDY
jgi:hypothetical protein